MLSDDNQDGEKDEMEMILLRTENEKKILEIQEEEDITRSIYMKQLKFNLIRGKIDDKDDGKVKEKVKQKVGVGGKKAGKKGKDLRGIAGETLLMNDEE